MRVTLETIRLLPDLARIPASETVASIYGISYQELTAAIDSGQLASFDIYIDRGSRVRRWTCKRYIEEWLERKRVESMTRRFGRPAIQQET